MLIDAPIDVPWQLQMRLETRNDLFISPASITHKVDRLAHQPRNVWTLLAEVRPFDEPW